MICLYSMQMHFQLFPVAAPRQQVQGERRWSGMAPVLFSFALFAAATIGAYLAQESGMRVSAALIYVMSVTLIGAATGLRIGLLTAITASIIFNFFLSEPILQFGAASAEEYVPLIAFNLTAVLSGALAGRLNDRAKAAEDAQGRINLLLNVSSRLQNAETLEDVADAIKGDGTFPWLEDAELFDQDGVYIGTSDHEVRFGYIARVAVAMTTPRLEQDGHVAHALTTANGPVGVIVFDGDPELARRTPVDVTALVNLLSMAVERCILLSQRTEAAALRRSEEFKTAVLSSLSHDMRTPLAAISASASSLASFEDDLDRATRQRMLGTIQEQCERLNRYTANLLDLGKLEAGIGPEQRKPVDVIEILGAAIGNARSDSNDHIITKSMGCSSAIVLGNAVMVEQLLYNVIENALRYSPSGSEVLITGKLVDGTVQIGVMDQGCGIPADELPRIFERFYRSTRTLRQEGQGLGLSITKGFVEAFGGTIRVASPYMGGLGTHVIIELPLAKELDATEYHG